MTKKKVTKELKRKLFTVKGFKLLSDSEKDYIEFDVILKAAGADRDGDTMNPEGLRLPKDNSVPLLWGHKHADRPAIGRVEDIRWDGEYLKGKARIVYRIRMGNEEVVTDEVARLIAARVISGDLRTVSIGFYPIKSTPNDKGGVHYDEYEVVELSLVNVPADDNARIVLNHLGISECKAKDACMIAEKQAEEKQEEPKWTVVKFESYPVVEGKWDKRRAIVDAKEYAKKPEGDGIVPEKFRKFFTVYDANKPENITSYKFPHHVLVENKVRTHKQGVFTAMAFLWRWKGPEEVRKKIYNHLAKHYKEDIGREPPEYKDVKEFVEILSKAGYVLVKESKLKKYRKAYETLKEYDEAMNKYRVQLDLPEEKGNPKALKQLLESLLPEEQKMGYNKVNNTSEQKMIELINELINKILSK